MSDIKSQFKIFENYKKENEGKSLVYLDSSASSLTPDVVVEKMNEYYFSYRSNIDRAISKISQKATSEYDKSRIILADYLGCESDEIIWTPGATAASNMLTDMIGKHDDEHSFLNEGDEILTSIVEHHSSLVPLQELAKKKNLNIKFLNINKETLSLEISNLKNLVIEKTKIVSICLASNVTGEINDIKIIVEKIKAINKNVFVICDMTAAFGHIDINLNKNDSESLYKYIDAAYFSMHKAFGPTGVGALFVKREISRNLTPTVYGGGMISHVYKDRSEWRSDIKVFEAGTANIAGVIGAGEAIKLLQNLNPLLGGGQGEVGISILKHNQDLVRDALAKIKDFNQDGENIKNKNYIKAFAGRADNNIGIVSFQVFINDREVHPHDVAEIFARYHISLRAGHHCAEPLMHELDLSQGVTRVSFHIYNDSDDIDSLSTAINEVKKVFEK